MSKKRTLARSGRWRVRVREADLGIYLLEAIGGEIVETIEGEKEDLFHAAQACLQALGVLTDEELTAITPERKRR